MSTFICKSLNDLESIAAKIINEFPSQRIFAFYGKMGVGKTTLIKQLCKQLGIRETANSPTFAIVNEYTYAKNQLVYHFDFYRLKDVSEAYDIGLEEYIASGHYCFMEWPEVVEEFLPDDLVEITLEEDNEVRTISIK